MSDAGALEARSLTKTFGTRAVVDGVSLRVENAERFVILGPSGSGKTTLLRLLAGLETPDAGSVLCDGRDVTAVPPHRRGIAMVFPHGALFPNLTVRGNLAFTQCAPDAAAAAAQAFGLEALMDRRPAQLSGGERQRVAIARALLASPGALLLDEPLASLDPPSRESVRALVLQVARQRARAVVVVTHDHEEALATADRLAILFDGKIVQCGAPDEVYARPANAAVAKFLGPYPMNLIPSNGVQLGIRPHDVLVNDGATDAEGVVTSSEFSGNAWIARVETGAGEVCVQHGEKMREGERVRLGFPAARIVRFDAKTGEAIE